MFNAVSIFVLSSVLYLFGTPTLTGDDNDCTQKTIKDAWLCAKCGIMFDDNVTKDEKKGTLCKACSKDDKPVKAEAVKVCEREWWTSGCKHTQIAFEDGKCCNVAFVKRTGHSLIVDKCSKCGSWAMPGKEIKHNESKHSWKCGGCGMEMAKDTQCCGQNSTPNIQADEIKKSVCQMSGTFPHNPIKGTNSKEKETSFANPKPNKCPVSGEDIDSKISMEHKGKTYAFCCIKCVAKFKANPGKYLKEKE